MRQSVTHDGKGALQIDFPHDPNLNNAIKALSGRWNSAERFWWTPEDTLSPAPPPPAGCTPCSGALVRPAPAERSPPSLRSLPPDTPPPRALDALGGG